MIVVVPHTEGRIRPETTHTVAKHADFIDFARLDDDEAYWRLLRDYWIRGHGFAVVEQDIILHAAVIPEFEACPEPWCTFGYPYDIVGGTYHGSGCVRWRTELITAIPDLWDRVGRHSNPDHPPRHWCTLDAYAQLELANAGYQPHRHEPAVGHVDTSCSHGCHPSAAPA